jgi:hypothetical protein
MTHEKNMQLVISVLRTRPPAWKELGLSVAELEDLGTPTGQVKLGLESVGYVSQITCPDLANLIWGRMGVAVALGRWVWRVDTEDVETCSLSLLSRVPEGSASFDGCLAAAFDLLEHVVVQEEPGRDDLHYESNGLRVVLHGSLFVCTSCGKTKPGSQFGLRRMGPLLIRNQSQCSMCRSQQRKA